MTVADRLYKKKWGVFSHYLYGFTGDSGLGWNERLKTFNPKKLAENLREMGAGYFGITLMQGHRYMLAPNKTYDEIMGTKPGEACGERDVILELSDALAAYDIDLMLYYTGDGPFKDPEGRKAFGFGYDVDEVYVGKEIIPLPKEQQITMDFVKKWTGVLEEFSLRYGDRVSAWWIDGCYHFFGYHNELLKPYEAAVKKGNPQALFSLNNGVSHAHEKWYENQSLIAGEQNEFTYVPKERFTEGAQNHVFSFLGDTWGGSGVRYSNDYMRDYIKKVNENGGIVTVDIHINADGSFLPEQKEALMLKNL